MFISDKDAIKDMHDAVVTSIRTIGRKITTSKFQQNRLHQGSILNQYLFALAMNDLKGTYRMRFHGVLFANDITQMILF